MLEVFVLYPDGSGWTAESIRRPEGADVWVTLFKLTCPNRSVLMQRLAKDWRGVKWIELKCGR